MTTQNKNGNGVATLPEKENGKTTVLTVVKPEDKKPGEEKPAKKAPELPPLDERLHRLNQLFDLQQKYNQLQQSLIKLKAFELGKDDDSCRISFTDKNRNEFYTSNQFLMPKFLAFVKAEITAKIKEIEPQLNW